MATIKELKKAIKVAEKARNAWDGNGEIPVTYDALCDLRSQLTLATIEAGEIERQQRQADKESEQMWAGIWARIEGVTA